MKIGSRSYSSHLRTDHSFDKDFTPSAIPTNICTSAHTTEAVLFYSGPYIIQHNFFTADVFMVIFQCTPQEKVWNPSTPGHCINKSFILLRPAVANVFTDVFIAVLPAKIIWGLQMPRRRKISVTAVFTTGLL